MSLTLLTIHFPPLCHVTLLTIDFPPLCHMTLLTIDFPQLCHRTLSTIDFPQLCHRTLSIIDFPPLCHMTLSTIDFKEGQQKYCETVYSRSGINHMWILKNSKDLLDNLKPRSFSQVSSIKTYDFSTLYTTLPHDKLKPRLKETIHKAFSHRNNGSNFVVLGYNSTYFSNKIQKGKTCYSEEQGISMLEFLIDNIFVSFGGAIFSRSSA